MRRVLTPGLSQVLAGGRTRLLLETVTTAGMVTTGTFTSTGEKTGKIDLHKSKVVLIKTFSPAAIVPVGSCGKDNG